MRRIPQIQESHFNHGTTSTIVCTVTAEHEIAFHPEDVLKMLRVLASDNMAKVINQIGAEFNRDQLAECYAADSLDAAAREFIDSMYFFVHAEDEPDATATPETLAILTKALHDLESSAGLYCCDNAEGHSLFQLEHQGTAGLRELVAKLQEVVA